MPVMPSAVQCRTVQTVALHKGVHINYQNSQPTCMHMLKQGCRTMCGAAACQGRTCNAIALAGSSRP